MLKVQTPSGVGYIPLVDPSSAAYPYLKIQTANHGILAVHDVASTIISVVDDFEDGNKDGWTSNKGSVTSSSYWGTYSLESKDINGGDRPYWEEPGPWDSMGGYDIYGTWYPDVPKWSVNLELRNMNDTSQYIRFQTSKENNETSLTASDGSTTNSDSNSGWFGNSWYQFRFRIDSSTVRWRNWPAGDSEPSGWDLQTTVPSNFDVWFRVSPGGGGFSNRRILLDQVTYEGPQ